MRRRGFLVVSALVAALVAAGYALFKHDESGSEPLYESSPPVGQAADQEIPSLPSLGSEEAEAVLAEGDGEEALVDEAIQPGTPINLDQPPMNRTTRMIRTVTPDGRPFWIDPDPHVGVGPGGKPLGFRVAATELKVPVKKDRMMRATRGEDGKVVVSRGGGAKQRKKGGKSLPWAKIQKQRNQQNGASEAPTESKDEPAPSNESKSDGN